MSNVRQPRAWSNPVLLPTWTLYVCVHAGATVTRSARSGQLGHVLFFFSIFFFFPAPEKPGKWTRSIEKYSLHEQSLPSQMGIDLVKGAWWPTGGLAVLKTIVHNNNNKKGLRHVYIYGRSIPMFSVSAYLTESHKKNYMKLYRVSDTGRSRH